MKASEFSQSLRVLSSDLHFIVDTFTADDLTLSDELHDIRHRLPEYTKQNNLWSIGLFKVTIFPNMTAYDLTYSAQYSKRFYEHLTAFSVKADRYYTHLSAENQNDDNTHIRSRTRLWRACPSRSRLFEYASRAHEINGHLTIEKRLESRTKFELLVQLDQIKNRPLLHEGWI